MILISVKHCVQIAGGNMRKYIYICIDCKLVFAETNHSEIPFTSTSCPTCGGFSQLAKIDKNGNVYIEE